MIIKASLNTNADTIASSLAVGLSNAFNTSIYYCFELNGVLKDFSDKTSVIKHINKPLYTELLNQKRIADGMLPKMANCFKALENGVQKVYIGNTNILTKTNTNYTTITL
jgi:Acetylglutamate kinase